MLEVVLCMAAGILLGKLLKIRISQKAITIVVWLMLFFLGWEAGGDENVMRALPSIGLDAIAFALAGVTGSATLAFFLWKSSGERKKGNGTATPDKDLEKQYTECPSTNRETTIQEDANTRAEASAVFDTNGEKTTTSRETERTAARSGIRDSLIVIGFFAIGTIIGISGLSLGDGVVAKLSFWSLCALILMIGMSVGGNPDLISSLKSMNPKLALLPAATIIGTFAGCLVINVFLGYKASDALAVGSGFGYYSLSSLIISGSRGLELGTIALIANIIREITTLIGSPLIARIAGPLAPIAAGGATTADTTLPIIRTCSGERLVLLSIYHGILVDFSVPFLVSFFCAL